ncbi:hypothetical protein GCM10011506_17940 [Marivirga lumbricoides]|uniref:HTH araC/xylS-type domain-containing protein n=1 Tax=Marivirga lumbricoides TaxID=1046115 RepID=A0ABQ1M350_9BACT|nr:hypothetical protein GCM10011506_17940 [Marivirga lumbricoides]
MNRAIQPLAISTSPEKSLSTLVENRRAYTYDTCELNVFETHEKAENVGLVFNDFVFTSMLRGKKIMHLNGREAFDYLPGESVIVGPNELMQIDFPEAENDKPTQCIALAISQQLIDYTLELMNEKNPKVLPAEGWAINPDIHHIINNQELINTVDRIIRISTSEQTAAKDLYVDLALKEMIIRLMQTQAREVFTSSYQKLANHHPLAYAIQIIKSKIDQKIDFDKLASAACMSRATFFKKFKEAFGYTPAQYVLNERLELAKKWLRKPDCSITQACFNAGFENLSHFTQTFKKETGMAPSKFKKVHQQKIASAAN